MKNLLNLLVFLIFILNINAEVVYLKDGQVINGAIIRENKTEIWIKSKYKTSKILRENILRVLYGERKLETIYIQLKNNTIIKAFLVDQDNNKVIIRRKQDSSKEETIFKEQIKQMSQEKILLFFPGITVRPSTYIPLNTGKGANLKPAFLFLAGYSVSLPFAINNRLEFETGYVKNISNFVDVDGNIRELNLQTIPIMLYYSYNYNLKRFFKNNILKTTADEKEKASEENNLRKEFNLLDRFSLIGKVGVGSSFLIFDDGEGQKLSGIKFSAILGLGISTEILKKEFYINLYTDLNYVQDSNDFLISIIFSLGLSYRF